MNYRPRVLVKGAPTSLYSQLPDTSEIQFAREMTDMQSEVTNLCPVLEMTFVLRSKVIQPHTSELGVKKLACK